MFATYICATSIFRALYRTQVFNVRTNNTRTPQLWKRFKAQSCDCTALGSSTNWRPSGTELSLWSLGAAAFAASDNQFFVSHRADMRTSAFRGKHVGGRWVVTSKVYNKRGERVADAVLPNRFASSTLFVLYTAYMWADGFHSHLQRIIRLVGGGWLVYGMLNLGKTLHRLWH